MNIKHMEYMIVLSEEKNFSSAAEKLGVTQPTLTQAVQKAENSLGVQLFERNGRAVQPTKYGEIFLESCRYMTGIYNDTVKQLRDMKDGIDGKITIGIAPSRAPYVMPQAFVEFKKEYPHVQLEIIEMLTNSIETAVENGALDIGVLVTQTQANSHIEYIPFAREQILVAVHKSLLDEKNGTGCMADRQLLSRLPFVLLGEEQKIVSQFRKYCDENNIEINCVARCKNVETSLAMANAAIGATLVTSSGMDYYHEAFPSLVYFSTDGNNMSRDVSIICRKKYIKSVAIQKLIDILCEKE